MPDLVRDATSDRPRGGGITRRSPRELAPFEGFALDEPEAGEEGIDLRHYWRVLVRRKWTVATFFAIVVSAIVVGTYLTTPIYRSTLTLQIDREPPKILTFGSETAIEPSSLDVYDFYQTQYRLLQSKALARRVVDQIGLGSNERFLGAHQTSLWQDWFVRPAMALIRGSEGGGGSAEGQKDGAGDQSDAAAGRLLTGLTVDPVKNSRLVRLHFDSESADLAATILNALAQAYMSMNMERRFDASSFAKGFLEERLQSIKEKLEEAERKLAEFARQHEILDIEEKETIATQELAAMTAALLEAERQRIGAETQYRGIQSASGGGHVDILESEVIQLLKEERAKLQAQYQEKRKVFKPAYPVMQQLGQQIKEIDAQIGKEVTDIRGAALARFEAAKAEEAALKSRVSELKDHVISMQSNRAEYSILSREVNTNRQLYDSILQRIKEAGLNAGVALNNVSVVDAAEPGYRFKPDLGRNLQMAMLLGLFGGIGLALFFEHLDDTYKAPEDLERKTGLSPLGVIPEMKGSRAEDAERNPLALMSFDEPKSGFAEAFRSARTSLLFSTSAGAPKVLHFTSPGAAEGKTTCAVNTAITFTQTGSRVLLIDADLRRPSVHKVFRLDNAIGLTNYLAGSATPVEISRASSIPRLFVIPSGRLPPNPAELLSSAKMVDLLSLAAERFDHVIVDGPPVLGLADALLLANLANGTVVVVEAAVTRRKSLQGALRRLRSAQAHLVGSYLSKLSQAEGAYGYYSSYYYYYADQPRSGKALAV